MNDTTSSPDLLDHDVAKPALPSSINVLTILTFIGCGLSAVFLAIYPFLLQFGKKALDRADAMSDSISTDKLQEMERSRAVLELSEKNMVLIIGTSFAGVVLCLIGALMMRKLKKDGFWLYVAGEILPLIVGAIVLGLSQFTDWKTYLNYIVPAVFIILYAAQMKYLVK